MSHAPGSNAKVPPSALLGSEADKRQLAILANELRGLLKESDDAVVAALRMHIRPRSHIEECFRTLFTCGIWLLIRPPTDFGAVFLTTDGRLIMLGHSSMQSDEVVSGYFAKLVRVICILFFLICFCFHVMTHSMPGGLGGYERLTGQVLSAVTGLTLVFSVLSCYAQHQRQGCGTSYKQQFDVADMCTATYAREDIGRRCFCAVRERTGQLRLCFTKKYPDEPALSRGLVGTVKPSHIVGPTLTEPPAMAAGETELATREKEAAEQESSGGSSGGIGLSVGATVFLTCLSVVASSYDYLSLLKGSAQQWDICVQKVDGCQWSEENTAWVGRRARVDGALPPFDYNAHNCDPDGNFCDKYFFPRDHCLGPPLMAGVADTLNFTISCPSLDRLLLSVVEQRVVSADGKLHLQYLTTTRIHVPTLSSQNATHVLVAKNMALQEVSAPDGSQGMDVTTLPLDPSALRARCEKFRGSMQIHFKKTLFGVPLFEEDCAQLQSACMAEAYSPESFGWWPSRLLDPRYNRMLCSYHATPVLISNHGERVWRVLETTELACHGTHKEVMLDNLEDCKAACEKDWNCNYIFFSRDAYAPATQKLCRLFRDCPHVGTQSGQGDEFRPVTCGTTELGQVPRKALEKMYMLAFGLDLGGCRDACLEVSTDYAQCNAFAASFSGRLGGLRKLFGFQSYRDAVEKQRRSQPCVIYGPHAMQRPRKGDWTEFVQDSIQVGSIQDETDTCFMRARRIPTNRKPSIPGVLLHHSDTYNCNGCWTNAISAYYMEIPNLFSLIASVFTLLAFSGMVWKSRQGHASKVAFSGTSIVDLTFKQDAANPTGFAEREEAYLRFLSACWEVAAKPRAGQAVKARGHVWETHNADFPNLACQDVDVTVRPVDCQDFDTYETADPTRTFLHVDMRLLAIAPTEKIIGVWSEMERHGVVPFIITTLLYYVSCWLLYVMLPHILANTFVRVVLWGAIPLYVFLHFFLEIRAELQCLCVVTNTNRVVRLSRRPPKSLLGILCPHLCGETNVRLDSFHIGDVMYVQLDMPRRPLCRDWVMAGLGLKNPWRRGTVTLRCKHGLLQAERTRGEVMVAYNAFNWLAVTGKKRMQGLRVVCRGDAELGGIKPSRDLVAEDETLIWEKLDDYPGYFTDPFNYSSLLALTDRRLIVLRKRSPKPLSCRGLLVGPLTLGSHCLLLQESWGYHSCVTLTSIALQNLESYAEVRRIAPPIWPGLGEPKASVSLHFLPRTMKSYPASLTIKKWPYGLPLRIHVVSKVALRRIGSGNLRIWHSTQADAPRWAKVLRVVAPDGRPLSDPNWASSEGALVPAGSEIQLEKSDELDHHADEPWLLQIQEILDDVTGKSKASEECWVILDADEALKPAEQPSRCLQIWSHLCGGDMLGLHPYSQSRRELKYKYSLLSSEPDTRIIAAA